MGLLTKATRKKWMNKLGYEYNKDGIRKLQAKYFKRKQDIDGIYGPNTDILLRHVHHVKTYSKFNPSDFRCPCERCTGYPTWMRVNALKHIQMIKEHFGVPMKITSGLRCEYENARLSGSSRSSAHKHGKAVDFYMRGVTDSMGNRRRAISWIKKQKFHDYSYGDGVSSSGAHIVAPNMGNAIHTQVR